jgi:hypothetical protein
VVLGMRVVQCIIHLVACMGGRGMVRKHEGVSHGRPPTTCIEMRGTTKGDQSVPHGHPPIRSMDDCCSSCDEDATIVSVSGSLSSRFESRRKKYKNFARSS